MRLTLIEPEVSVAIHHPVFIGTAGWSVPSQYAERFAGPGTHLERYARVMTAAEINSSFYRPHQRKTYERWAASTPDGFRFSVKAPRQLTHVQRLAGPEIGLDRFTDEIAGLGSKLGAVLVQLPPSLAFDRKVVGMFFKALSRRTDADIICEPRHATWFTPEAEAFLASGRIARVAADPAPVAAAATPGGWQGVAYYRLHGSPRMYYSAYEREVLEGLAATLAKRPHPSWCIFDNTAASHALGDAVFVFDKLAPKAGANRVSRPRRRGLAAARD